MELVDLSEGYAGEKSFRPSFGCGAVPLSFVLMASWWTRTIPPLTPDENRRIIYSVLTDNQKARFEREKELDFSLSVKNLSRFRVNVHSQRGTVAMAIRAIPFEIRTIEELRLPPVVKDICTKSRGLVLVTGPTGSGKSTSLAAMVDLVNRTRQCHIITIEDPIEYLHEHKLALVEQRELESDTHSFSSALKYAMRQDPDVILVGEMRDLETIQSAITAAETGHLVFATLHTNDASQTVDRMIDVFPPHQQQQIRIQLASVLEAVFSQQLLPLTTGKGRIAAIEILIGTPAIQGTYPRGQNTTDPAHDGGGPEIWHADLDPFACSNSTPSASSAMRWPSAALPTVKTSRVWSNKLRRRGQCQTSGHDAARGESDGIHAGEAFPQAFQSFGKSRGRH